MLAKLAFRNIKRQTSSYIIYFITVVFTVALMFAANNVLFSDELWAYNDTVEQMDFSSMFIFFIVIVTLVVCFIICYATLFLLRKRKKEFGTYLLLGIKRSTVMFVFLIENLIIATMSFICGCVLGIGVFEVLNVIICAIIGNKALSLHMSLTSLPITLLQWAGILAVSLLFAFLSLKRTKINDMIKGNAVDKKLPKLPLLEKVVAAVMFCLIIAACTFIAVMVGLLCRHDGQHGMQFFSLIGLPVAGSVLVVAIFFFYLCLRSMYLQKLKYKTSKDKRTPRPKIEKSVPTSSEPAAPTKKAAIPVEVRCGSSALKGSNIFHYRQMSSALNRNAAIMGIIAVLLSLSVILSVFTFTLRSVMLETIGELFDISASWGKQSQLDFTPEDILAEAEKYSEISFSLVFERYAPNEDSPTEKVSDYDVLLASDVNALFHELGITNNAVDDDKFRVIYGYFTQDENSNPIYDYDNDFVMGEKISLYGHELEFAGGTPDSINALVRVADNSGNRRCYIIIPDVALPESERPIYGMKKILVFNTKEYLPPAFHEKFYYVSDDGYTRMSISSRYEEMDYLNVQFSAAIVSAVFLGVTFMLMAMALLSLKVMADVDLDKRRYAILNMLGVNVGRQRKIMLRQLLTFFAAPLLIPLLMVIPSIITGAFISSFFLGYVHGAIYGIGFAVPLVYLGIYLCYFAATYYLSVKNCVRPMEKARLKLLAG